MVILWPGQACGRWKVGEDWTISCRGNRHTKEAHPFDHLLCSSCGLCLILCPLHLSVIGTVNHLQMSWDIYFRCVNSMVCKLCINKTVKNAVGVGPLLNTMLEEEQFPLLSSFLCRQRSPTIAELPLTSSVLPFPQHPSGWWWKQVTASDLPEPGSVAPCLSLSLLPFQLLSSWATFWTSFLIKSQGWWEPQMLAEARLKKSQFSSVY